MTNAYLIIHNLSRPGSPPIIAHNCRSFFCQLRGLMFRRRLPPGEGLLLVQSRDSRLDSSIHMMFMWIDLAVVWINNANQVVDTCLARRWRPVYIPRKPARYILEMNAEHLHDFQINDQLRFEEAFMDH
jgi:uncharacterized membrane protein (UPF0127 family)